MDLRSPQTISPRSEELEKTQITKYLELLANLVTYMSIARMLTGQSRFAAIDIDQRKMILPERTNSVQNVECPTAPLHVELSQRADTGVFQPNAFTGQRDAGIDN